MQTRTGDRPPVSDLVELTVLNQEHGLPLEIRPKPGLTTAGPEAFLHLWRTERELLDTQLYRYGALLFRGFEISDQSAFQAVIAQLKERLLDYVDGNSPRTRVGGGVYTSTEYPPEYFISMHNELSYSAQWPARLVFCCVGEPDQGGQTPLVDSRSLLRNLPQEIVNDFRRKGVRYIRNLHGGKGFGPSWQATFESTDRKFVEDYARTSGMEAQWNLDGSLSLSSVRPTTARHPVTEEEVWFNQVDQFHPSTHPESVYKSLIALYRGREDKLPQYATFADATPIPLEYLETIRNVTRNQLILFNWRRGDLLMIDNMLTAHGRMPFSGPRRILVAMTAQ
jgi:alpha-ketoglutarate-dependent taurine dioxygenase